MADDDSRTAVEDDPKGEAARPPEGDQQGGADETDWQAEAKKWERRAKENHAAAQKLTQIEESQKSEQQKQSDRLAAAEQRAATAEHRMLRYEVAAEKGLPADLAGILSGDNREDLEAQADTLLKHLNSTGGKPKPPPADAVAGRGGNGGGREPRDIFASLMKGG